MSEEGIHEIQIPEKLLRFEEWKEKQARDSNFSVDDFQDVLEASLSEEEKYLLDEKISEAKVFLDIENDDEAEDSVVDYVQGEPRKIAHLILISFAREMEEKRNPGKRTDELSNNIEERLERVENKTISKMKSRPPETPR